MIASSHSSSELLTAVLFGELRRGKVIGPHDLRFGDYVVSLTMPGKARMPNGVECAVMAAEDGRVAIGEGRLFIGELEILPGQAWNPVPPVMHAHRQPAGPQPLASSLTWMAGPQLTGDELLAGYVAGLVLLHRRRTRANQIAERTAELVSPLSGTLLRHAARGEVPEPLHHLLATGDPGPLLSFAPSGILWLRGLVSAGLLLEAPETAGAAAGVKAR